MKKLMVGLLVSIAGMALATASMAFDGNYDVLVGQLHGDGKPALVQMGDGDALTLHIVEVADVDVGPDGTFVPDGANIQMMVLTKATAVTGGGAAPQVVDLLLVWRTRAVAGFAVPHDLLI